jgi:hypothetical protein
MTTHHQHTEATHPPEQVEPPTATTEHLIEQPDSSTVGADPSTGQTEATIPEGEPSAAGADAGRHTEVEGSVTNQTPPSVAHSEPSTTATEAAIAGTDAPAAMTEPPRAETESPTERSLFADDELAGLRARWENVQAGFVDDPSGCVQKADGWCRISSTNSRPASQKRVRGSRNSGLVARRLPPKTFVWPSNATASSSNGCSRCETATRAVLHQDALEHSADRCTGHRRRGTHRASPPPDRGGDIWFLVESHCS